MAGTCAGGSSSWSGETSEVLHGTFLCRWKWMQSVWKWEQCMLCCGTMASVWNTEKRDLALLCCTSWADGLWGFHVWFLSSIKHSEKIQVEHSCLFKIVQTLNIIRLEIPTLPPHTPFFPYKNPFLLLFVLWGFSSSLVGTFFRFLCMNCGGGFVGVCLQEGEGV